MEFSKPFTFLTLLSESIKLIYKNPKPIVAIVAISLITPSIIIFLASCLIQLSTNDPSYGWAFSTAEIVFIIALFLFSMFINVSTILVSASTYMGNTISLTEVYTLFKSTFKIQMKTRLSIWGISAQLFQITGMLVLVVVTNPNATTISIAVLIGVPGVIYESYKLVVWLVAVVVSIIEQDCYTMNSAVDRANVLVEGQHIHGFLMNLFLNIVFLLGLAVWIVIGDTAGANPMIFVLVVIYMLSLFQIFLLVAHTVIYFDCRKHRGEEIESVGLNLQNSKLPTSLELGTYLL